MPRSDCATCGGPIGEDQFFCRYCGAPTERYGSEDDQRRAWNEARQVMAEAIRTAGQQGGSEDAVRARFLRNLPIPDSADLLIDDIFECQRLLSPVLGVDNTAPEVRFQTCLNRLELLATDAADLTPKVKTLREQLERHRRQARRNNWLLGGILLGVVGLVVGLALLLIRGLVLLFR